MEDRHLPHPLCVVYWDERGRHPSYATAQRANLELGSLSYE